MQKQVYIIICLVIALYSKSSNVLLHDDSLITKLSKTKVDTIRFSISEKIVLLSARGSDFKTAKIYLDSLTQINARIKLAKYNCNFLYQKAYFFYKQNNYDSAIYYDKMCIKEAEKTNYYLLLIKANINIGNIYNYKVDLKKAIFHLQRAEQYAKIIKDTLAEISTTLNLGNVFYQLEDYVLAKKYFHSSIKRSSSFPRAKNELFITYNNLATVFLNELPVNADSALFYYQLFLNKSIESDSKSNTALGYFNVAETYRIKKNQKLAEKYYATANTLYQTLEDTIGLTKVLLGTGDNFMSQNKNQEALGVFEKGLNYSLKYDLRELTGDFLKALSTCHYNLGNYKDAYNYFKQSVSIRDSLYSAENAQMIYDLQTKYETNEKEKENILLQAQNQISNETIKRQNIITLFIVCALLLLAGLAFFIYRGFTSQKRANKIITDQKHIIEVHQKETIDSINYAKRIQYALLANDAILTKNLNEHFILFKPKDIVSGDFYWATEYNAKFYFAVCDSTGHGVPGAFMSLLNMGFLNEAIKEKNMVEPHLILNYVRQRLIESIGNDGQQDGMDGVLMCFDKINNTITYAAANNEPILIRNNEITVLPKDKMPIGKGEKTESFTLNVIDIEKGDVLYLYTDGYADQFGGPKGKKLKYKTLNAMLLNNCTLPCDEQSRILSDNFDNWKGYLEQIDDVCVIGIRF